MKSIRNSSKLFGEFVRFARANRAYWIIPIILMLGVAGLIVVGGQAAAPLLYTLF